MSLERVKLTLLSHSKNMLNAAQSEDWFRFSELDSNWQKKIQSAIEEYGSQLDGIGDQLLRDNAKIQKIIHQSQKKLVSALQKNTRATSSVKQYLK